MPDGPDNTEKYRGTKYEGKTLDEIIQMHQSAEGLIGSQGQELGVLRSSVADLQTRTPAQPAEPTDDEREAARKADYGIYSDDLLVNPGDTVPRLAKDIEDRAVRRAEDRLRKTMQETQAIDGYFTRNPDLANFREIVLTAAQRLYEQNPSASVASMMDAAGKWAKETYLPSLRERLKVSPGRKIDPRKVDAITTSGGTHRDGVPSGDEPEVDVTPSGDPGMLAIQSEIDRIHKGREKKIQPPRSR